MKRKKGESDRQGLSDAECLLVGISLLGALVVPTAIFIIFLGWQASRGIGYEDRNLIWIVGATLVGQAFLLLLPLRARWIILAILVNAPSTFYGLLIVNAFRYCGMSISCQ